MIIVIRDLKSKPTDKSQLYFWDFKSKDPIQYKADKPQLFNFADFYSCSISSDKTNLTCAVWDYGTEFFTFTYKINSENHKLTLIEKFTYERFYQCQPISLKHSGNFLGVHCNIDSTNFEKIYLYYKKRRYTIYNFDLIGESTDFKLSSFNENAISLAIAGQDPKIFVISDQSYLDSNTKSIKDVEGVKLILDNKEKKTEILLEELFEDNSKPSKPKDNNVSMIWVISLSVGGILILAVFVFIYLSCKEDKKRGEGGFYNSMESRSDDNRSRAETIRNPVRESMISGRSDAKSRISGTRSMIRKPRFNPKITASGFYDED